MSNLMKKSDPKQYHHRILHKIFNVPDVFWFFSVFLIFLKELFLSHSTDHFFISEQKCAILQFLRNLTTKTWFWGPKRVFWKIDKKYKSLHFLCLTTAQKFFCRKVSSFRENWIFRFFSWKMLIFYGLYNFWPFLGACILLGWCFF